MPAPTFNGQRHQLLSEAIALSRRLAQTPSPPQQRLEQRLRQICQDLQPFAHPIKTESQPLAQIPPTVRRCFATAMVLLPAYARLLDPTAFFGTLSSATLQRYQPVALPSNWPENPGAIAEHWALSPAEAAELGDRQRTVVAAISRHRRVMAALREQFHGLQTAADGLQLFQQLFGPLPIPTTALGHLGTGMQLIFALDGPLAQAHAAAIRGPEEQGETTAASAALDGFLQQVQSFSFRQFARFPSFGPLEAHQISPELIARLVRATGIEAPAIQRILEQSIGLVPTAKAEAFLIHDVWGHFWQLLLTGFGGDYALLALADRPLTPGLAAYGPDGPLALRQLFRLQGDRVILDPTLARQFFRGEVQQRLGHLSTHLLAELLADVQEYQWLWQYPDQGEALPSSSLFKDLPAKLDLTLRDVDFFFPRLLEPLLSLSVSATQESHLEQLLLQEWGRYDGPIRSSLKGAIAQLQALFWQDYLAYYAPEAPLARALADQFEAEIDGETNSGHDVQSHWLSDFLGNLLHLQLVVNQLYTADVARTEPSFQAVMLLFMGAYCSADCYRDFWDLDDVLAQWLLPGWQWASQLSSGKVQPAAVC